MIVIKTKVVFNATILNDKLTGLGVYCKNILNRLENDFDHVLYTDKYLSIKYQTNKNIILNIASNSRFKTIILRNYLFKKWINDNKSDSMIHYSPTQHGIVTKGIKQIITIHDLIPLYFPKGRFHQYIYYRFFLKRIINNSDVIITVSNNTKNDIIKEYKVEEKKIKVVYNGFDEVIEPINKSYSKSYIREKYKVENYILMVGIHYRYKNLHRVIEAYSNQKKNLPGPLVIIGDYTCKYGNELMKIVKEKNLQDEVRFLGFVSNEDKNRLYQAASLFIYPSLYEGFGLPVLEAMSNETLVACSNTSSLPEVVADAAYKFNPESVAEIEEALLKMTKLTKEEFKDYINRGKQRLKRFSWDKCAIEIQEIINGVKNDSTEGL